MQKVISVIRYKFIFINILLLGLSGCSQYKLSGKYCEKDLLGDFSTCINFKGNNFSYIESNHLGVSKYGKGTYLKGKNKLDLNFNSTIVKSNSFFTIVEEINSKNDSIKLKFFVKDKEGVLAYPYNGTVEFKNKVYIDLNKKGIIYLKKNNQDSIKFKLQNLNYDSVEIKLKPDKDYIIDVFLSDTLSGKPIKNKKMTYNLEKINDSIIILNNVGIKTIWKKIK
ncbi:MAG: hypothetical protein V3V28_02315 [Polaribacter sp.]|uniref:hypothetical protein n=1 Tax=Polaribacter sp. TaxID=1920175 RepID=UPI002F3547C5